MPEDPDVVRLWAITLVCDHYGVLPSAAARELDEDPDMTALTCRSMSLYARARAAYEAAPSEETLKSWGDSEIMRQVVDNALDLERERRKRRRESKTGGE